MKVQSGVQVGTERNMTEIQLSKLGFKLEASITAMLESQSRVSSMLPLGLELIFSLIRLESGPDLSLSQRLTSTWKLVHELIREPDWSLHYLLLQDSYSLMGRSYQAIENGQD